MVVYYIFETNGDIVPKEIAQSADITEFFGDLYMLSVDNDENLFLLMDNINDNPRFENAASDKTINKAMRKYFPNCKYMGIIYLVKTVDGGNDFMTEGYWNHNILWDYFFDGTLIWKLPK
jgi:hypothetical protein